MFSLGNVVLLAADLLLPSRVTAVESGARPGWVSFAVRLADNGDLGQYSSVRFIVSYIPAHVSPFVMRRLNSTYS